MDLSDRARALTSAKKWVRLITLRNPAEATFSFRVLNTHVLCRGRHLNELFEFLLIRVRK